MAAITKLERLATSSLVCLIEWETDFFQVQRWNLDLLLDRSSFLLSCVTKIECLMVPDALPFPEVGAPGEG